MLKREKLKQDRKRYKRLEKESISMEAFLYRALGISDNKSLSNHMTHSDLKALIPNIARTSFDYVIDNPHVILNGEVYLVRDSTGKTIPYINPKIYTEGQEFYGDFDPKRQREVIPNVKEIDLSSLSIYELRQLLSIYSAHELYSAYRKVHRELMFRKESHCVSKKTKERILRKERKNEKFEY